MLDTVCDFEEADFMCVGRDIIFVSESSEVSLQKVCVRGLSNTQVVKGYLPHLKFSFPKHFIGTSKNTMYLDNHI